MEQLTECPQCGELSDDFRGDWCKDCDKQGIELIYPTQQNGLIWND
jgi:hypothetical protein